MSNLYYINAQALVDFEQLEIEAESEEEATKMYLTKAYKGEVAVSDLRLSYLNSNDLVIENHGECL